MNINAASRHRGIAASYGSDVENSKRFAFASVNRFEDSAVRHTGELIVNRHHGQLIHRCGISHWLVCSIAAGGCVVRATEYKDVVNFVVPARCKTMPLRRTLKDPGVYANRDAEG